MILKNLRSTSLAAAVFVGLLSAAGGCLNNSTGPNQPLSIQLTVDKTSGSAGSDIFSFSFEAKGTFIVDVVLGFGDGNSETVPGGNSGRVFGTQPHTYAEAGAYTATATVRDSFGESAADTVAITVQ